MTRFWMTLDKAVSLVLMAVGQMFGGETFVYKNPSYKVTDLASAIAPEVRQTIVGVREGEKIHEVMITKDDSRHTYDYGDYYIIYPNFEWFNFERAFKPGGDKIRDGFEYHSGENVDWLSVDDMKRLIDEYGLA
jgi:FlaA1/EpsC-like NDP-sugar epimerase